MEDEEEEKNERYSSVMRMAFVKNGVIVILSKMLKTCSFFFSSIKLVFVKVASVLEFSLAIVVLSGPPISVSELYLFRIILLANKHQFLL